MLSAWSSVSAGLFSKITLIFRGSRYSATGRLFSTKGPDQAGFGYQSVCGSHCRSVAAARRPFSFLSRRFGSTAPVSATPWLPGIAGRCPHTARARDQSLPSGMAVTERRWEGRQHQQRHDAFHEGKRVVKWRLSRKQKTAYSSRASDLRIAATQIAEYRKRDLLAAFTDVARRSHAGRTPGIARACLNQLACSGKQARRHPIQRPT